MAIAYKNIVITPNTGSSLGDPTVVFSGANTTVNTDITLRVYPDSNGTVSFEGSAGQLFSITNDLSGSVFSVNDISGIPLIEANAASQQITLGQYYGNVGIGTTSSSGPLTIDRLNQIVEIRSAGWLMMRPAANTWDYRLRTTGTGSAAIFGVYTGNNTTTPIMTYTAGGNIGVGTTAPVAKLDVNGTINTNNSITLTAVPNYRNTPNITANYTISNTFNEMSIGPITIANNVTVNVDIDASWVII